MKKVAIYTRVSSEEQVNGYSLENQEEKLQDYCESNDFVLEQRHIYREKGISGTKKERPVLNNLMKAAQGKEFSLVLVYKFDRFSRSLKNLLELVGDLEKRGIGFKSTTETFDTSTPMGKYMLQNLGSIAELEREMIRERTLEGQIKYLKEGNWKGGITPYGYDYNKETHKLEINKEEAKIVRKMYKWIAEEGLTSHSVQKRLNDLGISTKYGNLGKKKQVNGARFWKKRTVGRILTNEIYSGTFIYRKYKYLGRVRGEDNLRPKDEWIKIKTPRIVSKKIFDLVQNQINKNKRHSPRNSKYEYLFAHMIKCGYCGGRFGSMYCNSHKKSNVGRKRYFCYNTRACNKQEKCKATSVAEKRMSGPVWDKIVGALSNPVLAFEQLEKIQKKENNIDEIQEKQRESDKLILKNKEKSRRLLDLYLGGGVDKEVYEEKVGEIHKEADIFRMEKARYNDIFVSKEEKKLRTQSIQEMYERFKKNLEKITYSQKREVLKMLIDKVIIKGKKIDIYCNIPYKYSFEGQSTLLPCPFLRGRAKILKSRCGGGRLFEKKNHRLRLW